MNAVCLKANWKMKYFRLDLELYEGLNKLIFCVFFILIPVFLKAGGGWTKAKAEYYLKVSQWWVNYKSYYSATGLKIRGDRTRSIGNTSIYAEYGISDRINVIAYFPFLSKATLFEQIDRNTGNIIAEGDKVSSLGDSEIAVKYGILVDKPIVVSSSIYLGIPLGNENGGRDGSLQTGDGEFNQFLRLDISGSIKTGNYYPFCSGYFGFNNRTKGFSDEYRYGIELGVEIGVLSIINRLYGVTSLRNGIINDRLVGTNIAGNNTEFLNFSPELNIKFGDSLGISFTYIKPISGKLIFAEPSYSIGLFLDNLKLSH